MADLTNKKANFVSRAVQLAVENSDMLNSNANLLEEWFANGYASGQQNEIEDADIFGENQHLTAIQLQALMFTLSEIKSLTDGAHENNLYALKP